MLGGARIVKRPGAQCAALAADSRSVLQFSHTQKVRCITLNLGLIVFDCLSHLFTTARSGPQNKCLVNRVSRKASIIEGDEILRSPTTAQMFNSTEAIAMRETENNQRSTFTSRR